MENVNNFDVALCIEALLPEAQYFGSTTPNTKECFNNLNWKDVRTKPLWTELIDIWETIKNIEKPKTEIELLQEKYALLEARISELEPK